LSPPATWLTRNPDAALVRRPLAWPTTLLGLMSFVGLLLTYGLNTWLPQIMQANGYGKAYSLTFLLVLNLGAIVGGLFASYVADRSGGAQRVVVTTFILAAAMLVLLPLRLPLVALLVAVAIAGVGTIGTQVLIYGLVSNYYPTRARAAGVAWCAGFGRLGGIVGPMVGGLLVGVGVGGSAAFLIFAGLAVVGAAVTAFVPRSQTASPAPTASVEAAVATTM
jgi:AAHS family benzoate transporter-like MFS transporter